MTAEPEPRVIVVGAPIITNAPWTDFQAPLGQLELCRSVRRRLHSPTEIYRASALEYTSILFTLRAMSLPFRILLAHEQMIEKQLLSGLKEEGFEFVAFPPVDARVIQFPRDIATLLPDGTLLLDLEMRGLDLGRAAQGHRVILSPYGQGGRILICNDIALVPERWFVHDALDIRGWDIQEEHLAPLYEAGLRVGILPNSITSAEAGELKGYGPEDHLDRVCSLIKGQDGRTHLIVDPQLWCGFKGLIDKPMHRPRQALRMYESVCSSLGIEMHTPENLAVPGSVSLVQFETGQVLMTGGENKVAELVAHIVGEDNLAVLPCAFRSIPSFCKAGLRCLLNVWPSWFLQLPVRSPQSRRVILQRR